MVGVRQGQFPNAQSEDASPRLQPQVVRNQAISLIDLSMSVTAMFQQLSTKHLCLLVMALGFHAASCCVLFLCVEADVFKGRVA